MSKDNEVEIHQNTEGVWYIDSNGADYINEIFISSDDTETITLGDIYTYTFNTHWPTDIDRMHMHYGFHDKVKDLDSEGLRDLLNFRIAFLEEELTELKENRDNPEEIVDALVDLCVVAIGTMDLFGVDAQKAWQEVDRANMSKEVGIKESRPNPLGLPDLVKPEGWQGPDHSDNHGLLSKINDV